MTTIDWIIFAVYIVVYVISLLATLIPTIKSKNYTQAINDAIIGAKKFIEEAEQFKNYTGEEKFNYVLTRLKLETENKFSDETLATIIENLIDLTNNVNTSKKTITEVEGG